jgi:glutamate synthase domain-containing protein 2
VDAYYDTALDITWQKDADLAAMKNFGVSGIGTGASAGQMNWQTGQTWIAAMNATNPLLNRTCLRQAGE